MDIQIENIDDVTVVHLKGALDRTVRGSMEIELLALISYPIIEPIRRVVPPLGMLDFSAFIAIIALQVVYAVGHSILSNV